MGLLFYWLNVGPMLEVTNFPAESWLCAISSYLHVSTQKGLAQLKSLRFYEKLCTFLKNSALSQKMLRFSQNL
jgi:hypothetical protein